MDKIKVALVDDHSIVRDGIKSLIENEDDIRVVAEASNYSELAGIASLIEIDILLLDISLPEKSGIEISRIFRDEYPDTKIVILSMHTEEEFVFNAIKAGVMAYLPKNISKKELLTALRVVQNGENYFSGKISDMILKNYVQNARNKEDGPKRINSKLTLREKEVLILFVEGLGNKEIAEKLFISVRTVESHKNHIMQKLKLKNSVDLIKYAIKNKLVEI